MPGQSFLRFFLSSEDQARIDPASIVVEDIPYAAAPAANEPYPQSLRVRFRITNPQAAPPMIRPLFPGQMTFIRDRSAPGRLPTPGEVRFTDEAYATWPTLGTLMVRAQKKIITQLDARKPPEVAANTVWISGVRASKRFLFQHLPHGVKRASIAGSQTVLASSEAWPRHAVSRFLEGLYEPMLESETTIAELRRPELPTVDMAADGWVSLVITTARQQRKAFDGSLREFNKLAPDIPAHNPVHPCNGVIPARLVYRSWRADMLDAEPGNVLADAVLADWPRAPRYFPLRFTRIWKPEPECSVLLPEQRVQVVYDDGSTPPVVQRLPAHGFFYLAQMPRTPEPAPPSVQVSIQGEMRWMKGKQAEAWKLKAGTAPLPISLTPGGEPPHIILRRPFTEEMLADTSRPRPGGRLCTYMSMRRTLRAFIDHRISGGSLNFVRAGTARTRGLINDAWQSTDAWRVANNNPPVPPPTPNEGNILLMAIIKRMFPDPARHSATCLPVPTRDMLEGQVAYYLWQSGLELFNEDATRCYFGDALVGRGGAGAAVGFGSAELIDNVGAGEPVTTEQIEERLRSSLLDGRLVPGAIIQLWWYAGDFDEVRHRRPLDYDPVGHSPVFVDYVWNSTRTTRIGVRIIDQEGEQDFTLQETGFLRLSDKVCLAANWTE